MRSASTRRRVSSWSDVDHQLLLPGTDLQCERPLPGLREHLLRLEASSDLAVEAEPVEPTGRQHDRVESALASLAEPRVDVSPQGLDRERRLEREQLRAPPHRSRSDPHPGPQLAGAAQGIPRILPLQVRTDRQPLRIGGGHVLRRVHGDVDAPPKQRLLELLDEDPTRADLPERLRPVAVARGRDRHQGDLNSRPPQALRGQLGLRQGETRATRADPKQHRDGVAPARRAPRPRAGAEPALRR